MTRTEFLTNRQTRLTKRRDELQARALASADVNEVRALGSQIAELNEDLNEIRDELAMLAAEATAAAAEPAAAETRQAPPADAQRVNGEVAATFSQAPGVAQTRENTDPFATMEYRQAFMRYAQTGAAIPERLLQRAGTPASTNTLGATVPTPVLNEFINEVRKVYGNLYDKTRKLNIPGAVKVPIAQLQATARWINEGTVSPRQDGGKIKDFVEFSYNTLEIRVSQTLLSSIVTIDLFEREIVRIMVIAYMQAMDLGIVKGTGNGQMLGILNDPRVLATGNVATFTAAELSDWTKWRKNFFSKLPLGYRAGEFIFPLGTVDAYLETMADSNNNPIFRQATGLEVNDGDSRDPNGRFFGRRISLVEPDVLPDFDSAASGDVIGIYWQPEEYAINTNMAFGMRRYFDEETNEWVNKMLTIVDGKVLNPRGIWLIKKA